MNDADADLVRAAIKEYYLERHDRVINPEHMVEREFGFQRVGHDGMVRHQSYEDERALRVLLVSEAPSDVYCSNARYLFPSMPMKEKEWREADLIFDIDAKDLALSCRDSHSVAVCSECSRVSTAEQKKCSACSSQKVSVRSLPCPKCIKAAHVEVGRLLVVLSDDLGVDADSVNVYFSGNEGYHIHVHDDAYAPLGSRERRELADYVMFRGAIPEAYGVQRRAGKVPDLPSRNDPGWHGRLASSLGAERMKKASSDHSAFQSAIDSVARGIGVRIDPQVTGDIHRIFRLPGSINGKSGLSKVPAGESSASAYTESCLLGDRPVEVIAECPHRFSLGKKRSLGPYSRERVTVPLYAAVYMVCKGIATVPEAP